MTLRRLSAPLLALVLLTAVSPLLAQEYQIGPGDILKITVWGQEDLTKEYPVDPDGFVAFPLIGRIKAAGLTTKTLAEHVRAALAKDYLVDPQVLVAVREYRSQKVYVLGEAEKRGVFYLHGPTTLLEILSEAGGLSKTAGKQLVLVRSERNGGGKTAKGSAILRLDLDKIQAGDVQENLRLQDEDMVLIPKAHAIFVLGEVKNAGTFALEKETSVLEAVTLAGGFGEKAAPSGVKVIRKTADGGQETVPLDLSGTVPKDRDFKLQDGDSVLVPKGNTFFVFGEVKKPGAYQLDKETSILEAITIAGGFTDKAAPGRTRVIRNTSQGRKVIEVDMNDVIKHGHREAAMRLQENDVIVVPESFF